MGISADKNDLLVYNHIKNPETKIYCLSGVFLHVETKKSPFYGALENVRGSAVAMFASAVMITAANKDY